MIVPMISYLSEHTMFYGSKYDYKSLWLDVKENLKTDIMNNWISKTHWKYILYCRAEGHKTCANYQPCILKTLLILIRAWGRVPNTLLQTCCRLLISSTSEKWESWKRLTLLSMKKCKSIVQLQFNNGKFQPNLKLC